MVRLLKSRERLSATTALVDVVLEEGIVVEVVGELHCVV